MWPGKKKKDGREFSSADAAGRVQQLSAQGMPQSKIIKTMEEEGYTASEIESAMNKTVKGAVTSGEFLPPKEAIAPEEVPSPKDAQKRAMPSENFFGQQAPVSSQPVTNMTGEDESDVPQPPFSFEDFGLMQKPTGNPGGSVEGDRELNSPMGDEDLSLSEKNEILSGTSQRDIEETVEAVVEEKWDMIKAEISEINAYIGSLDSRLGALESTVKELSSSKKTQVQQIDEKIDTYKDSISELSARMEAMETAIKDSLTPMMQSLRSMSDTVKVLKKK